MTKIVSGISLPGNIYQFTEEGLADIEKALGVEALNDDQRRTLQGICKMYCWDTETWKLAPRAKEVRDWLKKIQTRAQKLVETLPAIQTRPSCRFHLAVDFPGLRRSGSWSQIINQAQDFLEQFPRHRHLGQLERDVPAMADNFGPDLHQFFP